MAPSDDGGGDGNGGAEGSTDAPIDSQPELAYPGDESDQSDEGDEPESNEYLELYPPAVAPTEIGPSAAPVAEPYIAGILASPSPFTVASANAPQSYLATPPDYKSASQTLQR